MVYKMRSLQAGKRNIVYAFHALCLRLFFQQYFQVLFFYFADEPTEAQRKADLHKIS